MNPTIEEIRDIRMWVETGKMNQEEIEIPLEWSVETGFAVPTLHRRYTKKHLGGFCTFPQKGSI